MLHLWKRNVHESERKVWVRCIIYGDGRGVRMPL
jgi:hypothetical protein